MFNSFSIAIILTLSIAGAGYYKITQNKIEELEKLNMAFELRNQEQIAALESLQQDFQLQTEALTEMSSKNQSIQSEMDRYLGIFKRHNLTKLAAAKPGLIETRVNKATKEVFDAIEEDSAAVDRLDDGVSLQPTTP